MWLHLLPQQIANDMSNVARERINRFEKGYRHHGPLAEDGDSRKQDLGKISRHFWAERGHIFEYVKGYKTLRDIPGEWHYERPPRPLRYLEVELGGFQGMARYLKSSGWWPAVPENYPSNLSDPPKKGK